MKKREIIEKEFEMERKMSFDVHIVAPDYNSTRKVSNDYDYKRKGFFNKLGSFIAVGVFKFVSLFIAPYCRLKIYGKKNIKGIKSAILTCNHINNVDCVLIKRAFFNKKLKITVAEFNNKKGIFGKMLRAAGTMPFGETLTTQKNLSEAINEYLRKKTFILFYPEGSLWWCYAKPRPLKNGAFYFAVMNNVPIVPLFFTFKNGRKRKDGTFRKKFCLNIGTPIYPNEHLSVKERTDDLNARTFDFNKRIYETFYGEKFDYFENRKTKI